MRRRGRTIGEGAFRLAEWVLERLATAGLLKGKTIGIDATTLEANAALRRIVRRDTNESGASFSESLFAALFARGHRCSQRRAPFSA